MTNRERALSVIGMASRAGKTASGEYQTEKCVKSGRAYLTVTAEDASDNTKKKFSDMCTFYDVPMLVFGTKEELGRWTGKTYRASICILDEGFAKSLLKKVRLNMEV